MYGRMYFGALRATFVIGHDGVVATGIKVADRSRIADWLVRYTPSSEAFMGKRFRSCFLSYSHRDEVWSGVAQGRDQGGCMFCT